MNAVKIVTSLYTVPGTVRTYKTSCDGLCYVFVSNSLMYVSAKK